MNKHKVRVMELASDDKKKIEGAQAVLIVAFATIKINKYKYIFKGNGRV